MNLTEWISEEQQRLGRFIAWYLREHQQRPEAFPLDAEPSNFDEAYLVFDE